MASVPPVVWVILVLAVILVVVRIWARRIEDQGRRVELHERAPRSLEGRESARAKSETHS